MHVLWSAKDESLIGKVIFEIRYLLITIRNQNVCDCDCLVLTSLQSVSVICSGFCSADVSSRPAGLPAVSVLQFPVQSGPDCLLFVQGGNQGWPLVQWRPQVSLTIHIIRCQTAHPGQARMCEQADGAALHAALAPGGGLHSLRQAAEAVARSGDGLHLRPVRVRELPRLGRGQVIRHFRHKGKAECKLVLLPGIIVSPVITLSAPTVPGTLRQFWGAPGIENLPRIVPKWTQNCLSSNLKWIFCEKYGVW